MDLLLMIPFIESLKKKSRLLAFSILQQLCNSHTIDSVNGAKISSPWSSDGVYTLHATTHAALSFLENTEKIK